MKKLVSLCLALALMAALCGCAADKPQTSDAATRDEVVEVDFDADDYYARLERCVQQIREKTDFVPDVALVLGSGLGDYADSVKIVAEIPYSDIQGFPVSTVAGLRNRGQKGCRHERQGALLRGL